MSMCCEVILSFVIFAVFVVRVCKRRPKKRCKLLSFVLHLYLLFSVITRVYTKLRRNTLVHGLKNKQPPYWIFTSGFDFDHSFVTRMSFCDCAKSDHRGPSYDVVCIFNMAAPAPQINFRFWVWWLNSLVYIEGYMRTKFGRNPSIYSWVKITSGFGKQTADILEFLLPFQSWPFVPNRDVILRLCSKFHRTPLAELWRHIYFSRWRPFGFAFNIRNDRPPRKCWWWS